MQAFLTKHQLPDSYRQTAQHFFEPLVTQLLHVRQQQSTTLYIGINGSQGSGKTTLADYLVMRLRQAGQHVCALSIDDFYLTKKQRQTLAQTVHPLLATRGVPGTHDVDLAIQVLTGLASTGQVSLPRFDKACDDRAPQSGWQILTAPLDIVILEGWCVAVPAQSEAELLQPINTLEQQQDADGRWRRYVNHALQRQYRQLWALLTYRIMLQAPGFDCVFAWRQTQEHKLRQASQQTNGNASGIMNAAQLREFISHYERLTRHALTYLPSQCDVVFQLDAQHRIQQSVYQ